MDVYNVQITDIALGDMEGIYNYILNNLQSPENAVRQYNRIADAIEGLSLFPERIKIMNTEPEHTMGIRQFYVDNYSVFYIIRDKRVVIIRVLYSSSDISKRLLI